MADWITTLFSIGSKLKNLPEGNRGAIIVAHGGGAVLLSA